MQRQGPCVLPRRDTRDRHEGFRMTRSMMLALVITTFAIGGFLMSCQSREADRDIALVIRKQVAKPTGWFQKRATVDDDDVQPLVRRFYKGRRYMPAWTHIDGPTGAARQLVEKIGEAPEHGLSLEQYDYERLRATMEKLTPGLPMTPAGKPEELAALDIELTRNFIK